MRSNMKKWMLLPVLALAAACSKGDDTARVDDALKNDLALAGSQGFQPQQFVSPMEQGYMPQGYAPYPYGPQAYVPQPYYAGAYGPPAPAQVYQQQPVVYRSAPARTTARSTARRSSGTYSAPSRPASGTVIKRNTKRDAVIGAAAGGVLGAVTSRDKVKGAVIGAAAGGLLGGIIGHTVDVQRVP